jgi:hypothetical protein
VEKVESICYNCESEVAKFSCQNCKAPENFFCVGCSILHPKIKLFRNHSISPIENTESENIDINKYLSNYSNYATFEDFAEGFNSLLDDIYENLSKPRFDSLNFWKSSLIVVVIIFVYYSISKLIFGHYSSIVTAALVLISFQGQKLFSKSTNKTVEINNLNLKSSKKYTEEEFKNEFWYNCDVKPIKFLPRTRPYVKRKKI